MKLDLSRLFGGNEDGIANVGQIPNSALKKAGQKIRRSLSGDQAITNGSEYQALFYSPVSDDYGAKVTEFLARDKTPSTFAIVISAIEHFDLEDTAATRAAITGSVLAETENNQPFHGNEHYRKVLLQAIRLIATHNQISSPEEQFTKDQIGTILAAVCIHDLGHDGKGNGADEDHIPYRLEQRSFDLAKPYFVKEGVSPDVIDDVETIVLCTDTTPFGSDAAPANILKDVFKNVADIQIPDPLKRLSENPALQRIAMIMEVSDIAISSGLSFEHGMKESRLLAQETGLDFFRTVESFKGFVDSKIGRVVLQMPAARVVFEKGFNNILAECDRVLKAGPKQQNQ